MWGSRGVQSPLKGFRPILPVVFLGVQAAEVGTIIILKGETVVENTYERSIF